VGTLSQKWFFSTSYSVTSTPVVLNGNVYFADWGGNIYSLKVADGKLNWKYHVSHAVSSTLLLANGLVYVGWGPFRPTSIIALDQATGTLVWSRTLVTSMHAIWASPIVYNGRLFIGVAAAENDSEGVSSYKGEIDALDAMTGSFDWSFKTAVGAAGGASVWGSVAVDPSLDSIYFGTGNAFGNWSGAATLYSYAIISLSASSGTLNWYHQVYTDTTIGGDLDFGSTPNLFTLSYNGNMYRAVGIGAKDGNYYIVDRTNGNPIVTETVGTLDNKGIIGLAGFYYPSTQGNPELFIPSSNYPGCSGCLGVVEALFPSSGNVPWRFPSGGLIVGSVAVVPGAVLFGDIYGNFYAVSIADGSQLFHTQVTPFGINGGITVAEGYVLFGNGAQPTADSRCGLYAFAPSG
jgi:polyvinyl alcohol dehydrogenase (cytochrome)